MFVLQLQVLLKELVVASPQCLDDLSDSGALVFLAEIGVLHEEDVCAASCNPGVS